MDKVEGKRDVELCWATWNGQDRALNFEGLVENKERKDENKTSGR